MYYLCLDVEAGGIGEDKSLLTLYAGVFNSKFEWLADIDLKIKPDNGIYNVTGEALAINHIDLAEHDKTAITYREAGKLVYDLLHPYGTAEKLIPLGHGVAFDLRFISNTIISRGTLDRFVSYRTIDTAVIARFMILSGKLPELSCSLGSLVEHFGIKPNGKLHEAKTDVMASIEVFKCLLELNKS